MLVRNYSNGSITSVDTDVVGVMATYLPVVHVCTAQSREALCVYCAVSAVRYTHAPWANMLP